MKILIVSQYFWPETFRINDLSKELIIRGHKVDVLTGKPNYPHGKFYKGYSFFSKHNESYFGANIYRVPVIPRGSANGFRLAINYLSFVLFSSLFVLSKSKKYDITFTFGTSPITQVFPALLHKKLKKSKSLLWLQDLWPESVSATSNIDNKLVIFLLSKMVKYIYKKTDKVLIQSEFFKENVLKHNCSESKVEYLPNWAEDLFINPTVSFNKFKHMMPDGFKVFFAGNIGEAQDFESIIKAIKIINEKKKNIKFVIIGDGRKRSWLENEIKNNNLQDVIVLLGSFPVEDMPSFFVHADVMLLSLKSEPIFSLTIPSKIQSYMAFGKPVVGMLDGIGSKIIQDAGCGYVCSAGNYNELANLVLKLYSLNQTELINLGINAQNYYTENFSKEKIMNSLESLF